MRASSTRRAALSARGFARAGLAPLAPALGALLLASGMGGGQAEAKTPGKTYCFHGKCHRVKTIAETEALVGTEETLVASHYDSCKRDRYNPCGLTSSGAVFDADAPDNAASPIYPDGTTLLVWSPETRASIVLRVNNAGPYWGNRRLDVSRGAAEVLGFAGKGVATLRVRVIDAPTLAEATYKKNRKYDPVPGYIGQFASLDEAQAGAQTAYMVAGLASPFAPKTVDGLTVVASAAMAPPVLPAEDAAPAEVRSLTAPGAVIAPVKVAGFVAVAEVAEAEAGLVTKVAAAVAEAEEPAVKRRSHVERSAARNSRSYRVAARKKKRERDMAHSKAVAVAVRAPQAPQAKRYVTLDGTNDMSVFSRHVYAGKERLAAPEAPRHRTAASHYGRSGRDGDEG